MVSQLILKTLWALLESVNILLIKRQNVTDIKVNILHLYLLIYFVIVQYTIQMDLLTLRILNNKFISLTQHTTLQCSICLILFHIVCSVS